MPISSRSTGRLVRRREAGDRPDGVIAFSAIGRGAVCALLVLRLNHMAMPVFGLFDLIMAER
ncbi:hypothetical protein MARLIPOL_09726 [Marinobacter lipolyticus SM19]|uniref:Uncharacterized protein n=1 Tax=Marinobacter lipolyticus SM19 TaxID=1318628 RepID=R8AZY8_9GAMM|nr:hypothetical protein MARLIPOL_09726 [Marinobacter lipolyticus SM19]